MEPLIGSEPPRSLESSASTDRIDLSELISDLVEFGHPLAARLVSDDRREYATVIAETILGDRTSDALAAQVVAWGERRDAAIVASNLAWNRSLCDQCAMRALATGDAASVCDDCVPTLEQVIDAWRSTPLDAWVAVDAESMSRRVAPDMVRSFLRGILRSHDEHAVLCPSSEITRTRRAADDLTRRYLASAEVSS